MPSAVTVSVLVVEAGILACLYEAHRRGNGVALANTAIALAATLVPLVLKRLLSTGNHVVAFDPALTLWVAVAGFLHSLGMLGLYKSTSWWDHLTHTVSAALVAALVYAGLLVTFPTSADRMLVPAATVFATLALGLGWEAVELLAREAARRYDMEPLLVYYGPRDTAYDVVFDLVGAVLVVALDLRLFVATVEAILRIA